MMGSCVHRSSRHWIASMSVIVFAFALGGCPKSGGDAEKTAPPASAAPSADASTGTTASTEAGAAEAPAPAKTTGQAASYEGSYSLAPAKMYIPETKDYARVKQAPDDPAKHVGEGTLTLSVDAEGVVSGTIDSGPAAPAVVDGRVIDGEIRGNVRRKDPADSGLTGTLVATQAAGAVEGKLSLAESSAAVVREGKLSLKKK